MRWVASRIKFAYHPSCYHRQPSRDHKPSKVEDTDAGMSMLAVMYGFADANGSLLDGYDIERVPWVNPDMELDERFYDKDTDEFNLDAIKKYVFGDGDIAPLSLTPSTPRRRG